MIVSEWLVNEELAKNSSLHFELISTIVASRDWEISMKCSSKSRFFHFKFAQQQIAEPPIVEERKVCSGAGVISGLDWLISGLDRISNLILFASETFVPDKVNY